MLRRSVTYPNIWASGTKARTTWVLLRDSIPSIWPRRLLRSPMTSPMNCSCMRTSTFMIGSRMAGSGLLQASLIAVEQCDLDIDDREPGVDARGERFADALVDRLDVFARDRAADDLVDELVAG